MTTNPVMDKGSGFLGIDPSMMPLFLMGLGTRIAQGLKSNKAPQEESLNYGQKLLNLTGPQRTTVTQQEPLDILGLLMSLQFMNQSQDSPLVDLLMKILGIGGVGGGPVLHEVGPQRYNQSTLRDIFSQAPSTLG